MQALLALFEALHAGILSPNRDLFVVYLLCCV